MMTLVPFVELLSDKGESCSVHLAILVGQNHSEGPPSADEKLS